MRFFIFAGSTGCKTRIWKKQFFAKPDPHHRLVLSQKRERKKKDWRKFYHLITRATHGADKPTSLTGITPYYVHYIPYIIDPRRIFRNFQKFGAIVNRDFALLNYWTLLFLIFVQIHWPMGRHTRPNYRKKWFLNLIFELLQQHGVIWVQFAVIIYNPHALFASFFAFFRKLLSAFFKFFKQNLK